MVEVGIFHLSDMKQFKYLLLRPILKLRHYINVPYQTKACLNNGILKKTTTDDMEENSEILKILILPIL